MATTDTTVRVMSREDVNAALRQWVDTFVPRHRYAFEDVEDEGALLATRRLGRWALVTPRNEDLYRVFVAGTMTDENTAEVIKIIVEAHEAFELFVQIVAVRFYPQATEITDEIRTRAYGFMASF